MNINVKALLTSAFVVVENLSKICIIYSYLIRSLGDLTGSLMVLGLAKPWGLYFEHCFTV